MVPPAPPQDKIDTRETKNQKKFFIQMSGVPGSGKSTTAKLLRQHLNDHSGGAVIIDHDTIRSCILEEADGDVLFDKAAKLSYKLNWNLVEDFASQGLSVINDGPCNYKEVLENGARIARKYGMEYRYVECGGGADLDEIDRRLKHRAATGAGRRSQRTGVGEPPRDVVAAKGAAVGGDDGSARELFLTKFDNPCRPAEGAILVQTTKDDPEGCGRYILEELGV